MSMFLVVQSVSVALLSPFGGVIADRYNRKTILVSMDIMRAGIVLIMAVFLSQHMLKISVVYISGFLLGIFGAVFNPAASAIIPDIVEKEEIEKAMSLNQFSGAICSLLGMVASGFLYGTVGLLAIFIINALSYLISGGLESSIVIPKRIKISAGNMKRGVFTVVEDMQQGFKAILPNRLVLYLMIMYTLYNIIVFPLGFVYFPYTFNVILKATPYQLALATGTIFLGMIIGSLLVQIYLKKHKLELRRSIFMGLLTWCLSECIVVIVLFTPLQKHLSNGNITAILFFLSTIIGISIMFYNIPIAIIFQKSITDEYRGRFWGVHSSLTSFTIPIGLLLGGVLAQSIPMVYLFVFTIASIFVLCVWVTNLTEVKAISSNL